jgi:hypothetical protein
MNPVVGWARVWTAAPPFVTDPRLRQGAWYPIVSAGATRSVLEIQGRRVAVPSELVEIRPRRPDRFTVVYRPRNGTNPARGTTADLGRMYAVCPVSGSRVRLVGQPRETKCPICGHRGEIAWWETG